MTVVASYVVRNEADRWLLNSFASVRQVVDLIHVYDDRSEDSTASLSMTWADVVTIRGWDDPSFEEDEGRFRQVAWKDMARSCGLTPDDWVLSLDADELLDGVRGDIDRVISSNDADSYRIPIHECFGFDEAAASKGRPWRSPLIRTDGWWGGISGVRLARFSPRSFKPGAASGSVPMALSEGYTKDLAIVHLGYALEEDRQRKYAWYRDRKGFNHNEQHIASIITTPTLVPLADLV